MQHSYVQRYQAPSPMRYVRKHQQAYRPLPPPFDPRERLPYAPPVPRMDYGYYRRPPSPHGGPRYYERRDLHDNRRQFVDQPRRQMVPYNNRRRFPPFKRNRVAQKDAPKEAKTKDQLDMELDKYMGNEAIKSRLDDQLANYFAEGNKEEE
ncbi:Fop carboxy-terminal duplication domain-containing protein, putative [Babesia ovata]|uniref:Fop carboxy-terminal duplication domain-containing protein, putative n=1 Tax=Babesia ovata TaxID=189622 RepID=A0A2H6KF93_9APIC|nr:Fop carboxy-terminal duplication domain-containing protein, putative [Babesia ovata]GBE61662.1 Fop carboxy-terminal duplication domain-containing protein, putative [Babesia ovata]